MKKYANEWNRIFWKEEVKMAKKCMKKFSASLAIKKMQIKTKLRFHLSPVKIDTYSQEHKNRCLWGCGHKLMVGMENSIEVSSKNHK
jgi:hypothetical protein